MSGNSNIKKVIGISFVIFIIISFFIYFFLFYQTPNTTTFNVDAGTDERILSNESLLFYGEIIEEKDPIYISLLEWDFDGDGIFDWSSNITKPRMITYQNGEEAGLSRVIHRFDKAGVYYSKFQATDINGVVKSDIRIITVDETNFVFLINIQDRTISTNDTLFMNLSLINQDQTINVSLFSIHSGSIRIYLINETSITLEHESIFHPCSYFTLENGLNYTDEYNINLSKMSFFNYTHEIYSYNFSAHPGDYLLYIEYISKCSPYQSWYGNMTSNIIQITITE